MKLNIGCIKYDCIYHNKPSNECACKLCVHTYDECPLYTSYDEVTHNERTRRGIIKQNRILMSKAKQDPIFFLENICGIKLKYYQKIFLRKSMNKIQIDKK